MVLAIKFMEEVAINNQINVKRLFSVIEVSKILGIGRAKVYELIKNGKLPALNLGGLKVRSEAIDEFLVKYEGYDLSNIENRLKIKDD